jgi:TolA-binding protein
VTAINNNPFGGGYGAGFRNFGGFAAGGFGGYGDYYGGWHQGNWSWYPAVAGIAAGGALGWLAGAGGDYSYSNPYYSAPVEDVPAALNYAQPIVIQTTPVDVDASSSTEVNVTVPETPAATPSLSPPPAPDAPTEEPAEDPVLQEAKALLDQARTAFAKGDYVRAQDLIEKGIQKLPGDATLHEFRALILFARKKYSEAAGTIYAVLSAGPGWNWDTLKSFYDDEATYKKQLRDLEEYVRANPKAADAHFLLAYHYLVLDAKDAAIKQLEEVVQLMPKDKLSAAILKTLKEGPASAPPRP